MVVLFKEALGILFVCFQNIQNVWMMNDPMGLGVLFSRSYGSYTPVSHRERLFRGFLDPQNAF